MGQFPQRGDTASRLELSRSAVVSNVATFRGLGGGLWAVLKANAYGHGLLPMVSLLHSKVDGLCVITAGEALEIRAREEVEGWGERRILVLGAVSKEEAAALCRAQVEVVVADGSWVDLLAELRRARVAEPLRIHLHIDTGLGREGFVVGHTSREATRMAAAGDLLRPVGLLSHFANTEDVTEQTYARTQLERFEAECTEVERALGGARLTRHLSASAAAMVLPPARQDILRVGIALYGLWPSTETRLSARLVQGHVPSLTPVLRWTCPSQVVKWLPAGSFVGYGCTYRCSVPTRVAVLPVGYFDGYPRLLSGRAHVLVHGRRCPVLGRVMMNHLIVDVTQATADENPVTATLLGRDGDEFLTAEQLATWADTIHYEVVARLGAHLQRQLVD